MVLLTVRGAQSERRFLYKELKLNLHRRGKNRATQSRSAGIRLILAILHGPMPDKNYIYRWSLGLAVSAVWLGYAAIAFFIAAVAGLADRDTAIAIENVEQYDLIHIHLAAGR